MARIWKTALLAEQSINVKNINKIKMEEQSKEGRIRKVREKAEKEETMSLSDKVGNKVIFLEVPHQTSHQSSTNSCFEIAPSLQIV